MGNDGAELAGSAAAQVDWSLRTDPFKVDGIVPGWIKDAEEAVGLLHEDSYFSVGAGATEGE